MRFLLDEDVTPRAAAIGRGLGLTIASVHEIGRIGLSDYEQLARAAHDGCIFVTHNRNDSLHWTREFFRGGRPHAGVLVLSRPLPRDQPELIAHALRRWADAAGAALGGAPAPSYVFDFVT